MYQSVVNQHGLKVYWNVLHVFASMPSGKYTVREFPDWVNMPRFRSL